MSNIFGRQVVLLLTNKSGGAVVAGDVVVADTTNDSAFTTTTSAGFTGSVGIAQESIANNALGRVLVSGYAALVNVNASVTRGHFGKTHTVAKQATDAGATRGTGTFCQFLTGGTTPVAIVFQVDLLGTSLSNPMTTTGDLIYSSDNSGTPARLAAAAAGKFLTAAGTGTAPAWGQGPLTTTGDLLIGATGGTPTRLGVGSTGDVLTPVSSTPAWAKPPGYEFDYAQITTDVNVTHTTDGTADTLITGASVAYDGSTVVWIEVYTPRLQAPNSASAFTYVSLYEDSTLLGYLGIVRFGSASVNNWAPMLGRIRRTPSNASHQYIVKGVVSTGTGVFGAGAGGTDYAPAYIRIVKA